MFISLLLASLVIVSSTAFAQGDYLDKGEGGIEISLGYSIINYTEGYAVGFGYTANSNIDYRLSAGLIDRPWGGGLLLIMPSVVVYPIKQQKDGSPISFAMLAGVDWIIRGPFQRGNSKSSFGFTAGAAIFSKISITDKTSIQPEFSTVFANETDLSEDAVVFSLSFSIFNKRSNGSVIRVSPGIFSEDEKTGISLSLGYLLPRDRN